MRSPLRLTIRVVPRHFLKYLQRELSLIAFFSLSKRIASQACTHKRCLVISCAYLNFSGLYIQYFFMLK